MIWMIRTRTTVQISSYIMKHICTNIYVAIIIIIIIDTTECIMESL